MSNALHKKLHELCKRTENETRKMHKNKNDKLWKKEKAMRYQKIELKYHKILTMLNANGCTK